MSIVQFPGQTPEQEPAPILLEDENGEEVAFDFLDTVERGDKTYIVLMPRDSDGSCVTIMQMVEDPGQEDSYTFYPVESEKTLNSVFQQFRRDNHLE